MKPGTELFLDVDNCPVRQVMDRFGDKWSVLILMILHNEGKLRFSELNTIISDVSQKMLTVTLRSLEADGLISRKLYPEIPPRVEYELTDMGRSLVPYIENIAAWASKNIKTIRRTRKRYETKVTASR